ncbi:Gti1/Pac2 family-domain-containing protein [Scleroderma yunnanense]
MQRPTCTRLRVRSPQDAQVIFHAVALGVLPMVTRRLDAEERRAISSGSVYVWEERGPNPEATGLGIERWTDGKRWGPSRVRDQRLMTWLQEFLFYQEKDPEPIDVDMNSDSDTTTALVPAIVFHRELDTNLFRLRRNPPWSSEVASYWNGTVTVAYFTSDSVDYLRTVSDTSELASLEVPPGKYRSARHNTSRSGRTAREEQATYPVVHMQYAPYLSPARLSHDAHHNVGLPKVVPGDNHQHLDSTRNGKILAPLVYLQNLPPPKRHSVDEEALMSFFPRLD